MWNEFLGNQILVSAVLGWTVAQFLKTVIDMVINKSFNPERIFGSGYFMPMISLETISSVL